MEENKQINIMQVWVHCLNTLEFLTETPNAVLLDESMLKMLLMARGDVEILLDYYEGDCIEKKEIRA